MSSSDSVTLFALTPATNVVRPDSSKARMLIFDVILWIGEDAEYRGLAHYFLPAGEPELVEDALYIIFGHCVPVVAKTEKLTDDEYDIEIDVVDVSVSFTTLTPL